MALATMQPREIHGVPRKGRPPNTSAGGRASTRGGATPPPRRWRAPGAPTAVHQPAAGAATGLYQPAAVAGGSEVPAGQACRQGARRAHFLPAAPVGADVVPRPLPHGDLTPSTSSSSAPAWRRATAAGDAHPQSRLPPPACRAVRRALRRPPPAARAPPLPPRRPRLSRPPRPPSRDGQHARPGPQQGHRSERGQDGASTRHPRRGRQQARRGCKPVGARRELL
ncbi:hypothetical protein BU14_0109s0020 [Porphyra umbilicalis]|uniref:Uncharacterized protein n=1 Tax=Porphyra umbilicalis TaxID=2786 RepID=A0A1X6PCE7_PORUM|nr:hypothetical protein BU14_0109s0020 [Porphyra umbilicalis]|eukprot:OSX78420.1 hypothetical protein BU14_0109s0020 [Porphyra umbilicalis]